MQMLSVVDPRFILMVLLGSVAGLFVGAILDFPCPWRPRFLYPLLIPGNIQTPWR